MLVLAAPFLSTGCDLAKMFNGQKEETAAQRAALPAGDVRRQTRGTARQLTDAFQRSQAVPAVQDNDPGRLTFDGADPLAALRDAPAGVTTGITPRYGPRPPIRYSDPPARGPAVAAVPGPEVNLPGVNIAGMGPLARGAGETLARYDVFQRTAGLFNQVYDVVSRVSWGAQAPRRPGSAQNPDRIAVHHTVTEQTMTLEASMRVVRGVQHYHRNVADGRKGIWDDIGYHFLIDGAGRVFEGRHAEIMGSHAGSRGNPHSVAISMIGNFDRHDMTEPQRDSMVRLVSFLSMKYRKDPSTMGFIEPHQHFMGTGCPGRYVLAFLHSNSLIRQSQQVISQVRTDSRFQPALVTPPA